MVNVDGRRTPDHLYTINSPCESDGSGELTRGIDGFVRIPNLSEIQKKYNYPFDRSGMGYIYFLFFLMTCFK